jgi:hypothetical protein
MRNVLLSVLACAAATKQHKKKPTNHGADVAAFVRKAHTADVDAVVAAKKTVHDGLAELLAYYDGDEQVLDALVFSTPGFANTIEAKLADLATASGKSKFVIAAFGSSVTAGHDGFGHTAWPAVLGRRLAKELEPLGIEVEVRNQAVGGSEPFPRSLCVGPIAGYDVDLVIREWEYWGMADGLEGQHGGEDGAIEIFLRTAFMLPNRPAVLFLNMEVGGEGRKTQQVRALLQGKLREYGDRFAVGVLSSFAKPFDHLRKAAPKSRRHRSGSKSCSGGNVGECPVGPKADGHHTRPLHLGVPEDSPLKPLADPARLFINWHPGTLGHEVMGHQAAYAVLKAAQSGLAALGLGAGGAKAPTLPAPVVCSMSPFCKSQTRTAFCATSTLPKHEAPDVGDWLDNSTQTQWRNSATESGKKREKFCAAPSKDCEKSPKSQGCWHHTRSCSYFDQKRAFTGRAADGPLTVRAPRGACSLLLSEPGYEWNKPSDIANWHHELAVHVDGEPCRACKVVQARGAYIQSLEIDLKAHFGGADLDRCAAARITLAVTPVASLDAWEQASGKRVCQVARNGKCEPQGDWHRYAIGCAEDPATAGKTQKEKACLIKPGKARPAEGVRTYVTNALAW